MKDKIIVGYTTGVFDLFHIGHLNVIKQAKENCDYLIVAVTTDLEVQNVKGFLPVIPFEERLDIVKSIRFVDQVVPESDVNKIKAWKKYKFDVIFKGDDWKGTKKWKNLEEEFAKVGVKVQYFPYTKGTSSTKLKQTLKKIRNKDHIE